MTTFPKDLILAFKELRSRVPRSTWQALAASVRAATGSPNGKAIADLASQHLNPDQAWKLRGLVEKREFDSWSEVAAILEVIDVWASSSPDKIDVVWTGPANGTFPIRRIDQVLYDLIATAERRILIVTFAAYRIPLLCENLGKAIDRGVEVTLLLESEAASAGQLSFDASKAFASLPLDKIRFLHWPMENRPVNAAGKPGKLHVKCAIIDDTAIIGSANLTDDAFNRNMELGIVLRSPKEVDLLNQHFEQLLASKSLARIYF